MTLISRWRDRTTVPCAEQSKRRRPIATPRRRCRVCIGDREADDRSQAHDSQAEDRSQARTTQADDRVKADSMAMADETSQADGKTLADDRVRAHGKAMAVETSRKDKQTANRKQETGRKQTTEQNQTTGQNIRQSTTEQMKDLKQTRGRKETAPESARIGFSLCLQVAPHVRTLYVIVSNGDAKTDDIASHFHFIDFYSANSLSRSMRPLTNLWRAKSCDFTKQTGIDR